MSFNEYAPVAQWIEHRIPVPRVGGSSPFRRTILFCSREPDGSRFCYTPQRPALSAKLKIFSRERRSYEISPVFRAISSRNGSSLLKQPGRFHGNGQDPVKRTLLGICRSHGLRPGVVQAEIIKPNAYTVSYVSDNAYSDGMQYPDFEEAVRACCPCRCLRLRHIRDVDGHFVTREECRARVHQAKKR